MSAAAIRPHARRACRSPAGAVPCWRPRWPARRGCPGLLAVPALDRDEARFAQATAQMLETRDPVNIRFQGLPRDKKPVGIHWLQAASVELTSSAEARGVSAYRWPSLLGAMAAAAACAWGAAAFLSPELAALAGVLLGAGALLSTEAFIAKTDAVLCGATTLAMAALARRYVAARGGPAAPRGTRGALWGALALAVLVKGPIAPMVAGLALLALWAADREAAWMRRLGWGWGLALVALVCGPWAAAITVATDGGFWTGAVGGDLAPKLAGGHEGQRRPAGPAHAPGAVPGLPGHAAAARGRRGRLARAARAGGALRPGVAAALVAGVRAPAHQAAALSAAALRRPGLAGGVGPGRADRAQGRGSQGRR